MELISITQKACIKSNFTILKEAYQKEKITQKTHKLKLRKDFTKMK